MACVAKLVPSTVDRTFIKAEANVEFGNGRSLCEAFTGTDDSVSSCQESKIGQNEHDGFSSVFAGGKIVWYMGDHVPMGCGLAVFGAPAAHEEP